MFTLRQSPQSSMGYAPSELLYGQKPRGLLSLVEDQWVQKLATLERSPVSMFRNSLSNLRRLRIKLKRIQNVHRNCRNNITIEVQDGGTREWLFGEMSWVFIRMAHGRALIPSLSYSAHFPMRCCMSWAPLQRKHFHMNNLKDPWTQRKPAPQLFSGFVSNSQMYLHFSVIFPVFLKNPRYIWDAKIHVENTDKIFSRCNFQSDRSECTPLAQDLNYLGWTGTVNGKRGFFLSLSAHQLLPTDPATVIHAVITYRLDYCNPVFRRLPLKELQVV